MQKVRFDVFGGVSSGFSWLTLVIDRTLLL